MAKSIWKLATDSFLVAKMQQAISAMGPVHNKTSRICLFVSRRLCSYSLLDSKCKDILSTKLVMDSNNIRHMEWGKFVTEKRKNKFNERTALSYSPLR